MILKNPAYDSHSQAISFGFKRIVSSVKRLRNMKKICITDPNALSIPPKISCSQVIGFATAMSKVVLNRGAGEAVSMARSNLRNIPRR